MITQFKTIDDISVLIKEYETILMRPTLKLSHPTLYRRRDTAKKDKIIKGIRVKDWFLSEDQKWVKPHDQMGLSFSTSLENLTTVYQMKKRFNPKASVNIYWILEKADIPPGLKFVPDQRNPEHYFLTVTEPMLLSLLVSKLRMLAHRMTVIRDGGKVL